MRVSSNRRTRGGGRQGSNAGRSSTSGNRQGTNRRAPSSNRSYDSTGPEGKIRGTAAQVSEKYSALARDAQTSGDHVAAENFFQHAEHYVRILAVNNAARQERQEQPTGDEQFSYDGGSNDARETTQNEAAFSEPGENEGVSEAGKDMSDSQADAGLEKTPATDEDSPVAEKVAKPRKPRQPRRPRVAPRSDDIEDATEMAGSSDETVPSE